MDDFEYTELLQLAERWEEVVHTREGTRAAKEYVTDPIVGAALELKDKLAELAKRNPPHLELLIHCPRCLKQHVDEGEYATAPHKSHACQFCGLTFQASGPRESIGVQFFTGYKNPEKLEVPKYFIRPSVKPQQVEEPSGWLMDMQVIRTGQPVRFDAEKVGGKGYDCDKVFTVGDIKFTPDGIAVRLNEELSRDWFPIDYFRRPL